MTGEEKELALLWAYERDLGASSSSLRILGIPYRSAPRRRVYHRCVSQYSLLYLPPSAAEPVISMGASSGFKDLSSLLKNMSPKLIEGQYVFCTVPSSREKPIDAEPIMAFLEKEGLTVILDRDAADRNGLPYNQTWAMITLEVYSDLQAVGFLAAITTRLAGLGISTNVVSAFFHDHLFVQSDKSGQAMKTLKDMTREETRPGGRRAI